MSCWCHKSLWEAGSHLAVLWISNCISYKKLGVDKIYSKQNCSTLEHTEFKHYLKWKKTQTKCCALLCFQIYTSNILGIAGQTALTYAKQLFLLRLTKLRYTSHRRAHVFPQKIEKKIPKKCRGFAEMLCTKQF